ncbi:hypothetical protein V0288_04130 [Pannus brasiliensis CCIBt3594]|uniref:Uncharacterized protein n=1 Tax=Pannus brasiliensis CCIBt3594 TaxID=1427578 RepID=A0AAW9QSK3_9CHRO
MVQHIFRPGIGEVRGFRGSIARSVDKTLFSGADRESPPRHFEIGDGALIIPPETGIVEEKVVNAPVGDRFR